VADGVESLEEGIFRHRPPLTSFQRKLESFALRLAKKNKRDSSLRWNDGYLSSDESPSKPKQRSRAARSAASSPARSASTFSSSTPSASASASVSSR